MKCEKCKEEERELEIIDRIDGFDNPFEFFLDADNIDQVEKATKELIKVIGTAAKSIRKIGKKYKKLGIGDTSTDETIAEYFYGEIHAP